MAVSATSTAKYICGTVYIIVGPRVGIFSFSVNKCDVTDYKTFQQATGTMILLVCVGSIVI